MEDNKLRYQKHPLNISITNEARKRLERKALAYAVSCGKEKLNISKYISAIANEELIFFTPEQLKSFKRFLAQLYAQK